MEYKIRGSSIPEENTDMITEEPLLKGITADNFPEWKVDNEPSIRKQTLKANSEKSK